MRDSIIKKRLALTAEFRADYAKKIAAQLFNLKQFIHAKNIACYLPIKNEVDTQLIIEHAWQNNKNIFLPVLQKNLALEFYSYNKDDALIENPWHILEPDRQTAHHIHVHELDCVIVPLVGFDEKNNRMGMGAGCYDRTFAFRKNNNGAPYLIGLAYEFQKAEIFPNEWDVPLDTVINFSHHN